MQRHTTNIRINPLRVQVDVQTAQRIEHTIHHILAGLVASNNLQPLGLSEVWYELDVSDGQLHTICLATPVPHRIDVTIPAQGWSWRPMIEAGECLRN